MMKMSRIVHLVNLYNDSPEKPSIGLVKTLKILARDRVLSYDPDEDCYRVN